MRDTEGAFLRSLKSAWLSSTGSGRPPKVVRALDIVISRLPDNALRRLTTSRIELLFSHDPLNVGVACAVAVDRLPDEPESRHPITGQPSLTRAAWEAEGRLYLVALGAKDLQHPTRCLVSTLSHELAHVYFDHSHSGAPDALMEFQACQQQVEWGLGRFFLASWRDLEQRHSEETFAAEREYRPAFAIMEECIPYFSEATEAVAAGRPLPPLPEVIVNSEEWRVIETDDGRYMFVPPEG